MANYLVVLFKNNSKKKIIKKYTTYKGASKLYDKLLKDSTEVIFEVEYENAEKTKFEIGIVELSSKQLVPVYLTDEFGRNRKVKLDDEGMTMVKVSPYKIEEEIYDISKKTKINILDLIKNYIKKENIKLIYTLNNKLIIQNDDKFNLFSLKNESDSSRLIDTLQSYFFKQKRADCIFVKDYSTAQRKYLIKLLSDNGIDKKILYRKFTTHPRQG